jgi:hypothetical protein
VVACICLLLPLPRRPSPSPANGSASPNRPAKRLHAAGVSRSSLFLTFRPPGLFATQVSPTSAQILPTQGSCDFYTRAKICTVTSTGIGHTSRPNQAIDGKRTSTFLDLQPCRPLSRDFHPLERQLASLHPTFPPSPLRCRTAGFPRYGSKAGISDSAFPALSPVKPAPGIPIESSGLLPSFVLPVECVRTLL